MKHWTMLASEATEKVAGYHLEAATARVLEPTSLRVRLARTLRAVAERVSPTAPVMTIPLVEEPHPVALD